MAATGEDLKTGRRVSIEEGRRLSKEGIFVIFRPEETLDEEKQYALAMFE